MAEHGKHLTGLKEQVDDYKKQVEDYKSQINELNGKVEESNKSLENLQTLTNENKDLKAQIQMSDSNVKKEFMKFVTSEINSKVNDDVDFATALNDYKKENPQYFGDTQIKKVQSSPELNGGVKPQTTNDIMNNLLRGN
jgi:chromosome segregation ATPase